MHTAMSIDSICDISPLMRGPHGPLRVVPASVLASTTREERALFGHRHGLYSFPTLELVDFLQQAIGGRTAIEIGAGHGVLAQALGIPATDNLMQNDPLIRAVYASQGQPTISYGEHVEQLDAAQAISKHKPQVVVACWVTHRYDPARHAAGGNMFGVDEESVINACETYIFIGNEQVHAAKSIWSLPHTKTTPPWLYSRALNGTPEFIAVWHNTGPAR